jgi:hypothetical protein
MESVLGVNAPMYRTQRHIPVTYTMIVEYFLGKAEAYPTYNRKAKWPEMLFSFPFVPFQYSYSIADKLRIHMLASYCVPLFLEETSLPASVSMHFNSLLVFFDYLM